MSSFAEKFDRYEVKNLHGKIRLELDTLSGDSDLYVSTSTLSPSYTDYDYHSATCGRDVVTLECDYNEQVAVAVFGYPTYNESSYKLSVWKAPIMKKELTFEELDVLYHDKEREDFNYEALNSEAYSSRASSSSSSDENENYSIGETLMTILVTFLKILLDIMV